MDIYKRTQKATSGQKLNPNRGIFVSTVTNTTAPFDLITYGPDGVTYSTRIQMPSNSDCFLIPVRSWGISFDSAVISAFGVS